MQKILQILKSHETDFVSGEFLAKNLGISRTAVWKKIKKLREQGYKIDSFTNKGYRLTDFSEKIFPNELIAQLPTKFIGKNIYYEYEIDSTNVLARQLAQQGALDGSLVLAEIQTAGRGRLGRVWVSDAGKGLWSTLILRPQIAPSELAGITIVTAVAMARAIQAVAGITVEVKWPNDLLYKGKKLAGILAELNGEMDRVKYLLCGIGVNINHNADDFPEELQKIATSLQMITDKQLNRQQLLQAYLTFFEQGYEQLLVGNMKTTIDYAREYSATLGKRVTISCGGNRQIVGTAVALDDDGSLWLEDENGEKRRLYSGEIIQ